MNEPLRPPAPVVSTPRNAWTTAQARQAGLLVDSRDYYLAFYRAALTARRFILLSGWQFDSGVELLRGDDIAVGSAAGGEIRLLRFLNHLCETRPELEIDILAWDFHVVLALEREWLQRILFHWKAHERLRFRFDATHPDGGCHHQKFAVMDGRLAFVGGIDLCEDRWDDRRHATENPLRLSRKKPHKPYHDAQTYLTGRVAIKPLVSLFCDRWQRSGGDALALPELDDAAPAEGVSQYEPEGALVLPPGRFWLSRTDPVPDGVCVREIALLHEDAIASAERFIYLETQYFSSREIRDALERRMKQAGRALLDVVLIVNERAEALKEQLAVGLRQAENLGRIREAAAATGHRFGCYFTVAEPGGTPATEGEETRTYIHTKLTIVDDRVLSTGSANLTNRSMGLDSELNVTWDAGAHEDPQALMRAIRLVRVSLLAEHAGCRDGAVLDALGRGESLVVDLDKLAGGATRLRLHPSPTADERKALTLVNPQQLPFDAACPADDPRAEDLEEDSALLRASLSEIWERISD